MHVLHPPPHAVAHSPQPQAAQFSGQSVQLPLIRPVPHWPQGTLQPPMAASMATAASISKARFIAERSFPGYIGQRGRLHKKTSARQSVESRKSAGPAFSRGLAGPSVFAVLPFLGVQWPSKAVVSRGNRRPWKAIVQKMPVFAPRNGRAALPASLRAARWEIRADVAAAPIPGYLPPTVPSTLYAAA